jgi:hypothetical protein
MKLRPALPLAAVALLGSNFAQAIPFTPTFSEYPFPGTAYTVDAAANAFFSTNYGITIDNSYLYRDSRDTFDGIGVANGEASEGGTPQTMPRCFPRPTAPSRPVIYCSVRSSHLAAYQTAASRSASPARSFLISPSARWAAMARSAA